MSATLYYLHDPMCSWCWALRPVWQQVQARLPANIEVRYLLGGLAPDTDEPMPAVMRKRIEATWHHIMQQVPGARFNFDFWVQCEPRRATYAACRAVIAAELQRPESGQLMTLAIQQAYYLQARNPSEDNVLIELAVEMDLDREQFVRDLNSETIAALFASQREQAHNMGVDSYPALMLEQAGSYRPIPHDYNDPEVSLRLIDRALSQ